MALKTIRPKLPYASLSKVTTLRSEGGFAASFYQTVEWRRLRERFLAAQGRACWRCGSSHGRMVADHIVEISKGGATLDETNLQILCLPCHNVKTAAAKAERE